MRIAILGSGAIGLGCAAMLCAGGHEVVLWSPSGASTQALAAGTPLVAEGAIAGTVRPAVARSCAEALADADCVLVAVPGYAHRAVIEAAAPHLRPGRWVVFSSHMSMAALLLRRLRADVPVVAWGSTVLTGRRTGPASVRVNAVRRRLDAACLPGDDAAAGLDLCRTLFGDRFVPRDGLLAIALSNLNPQNHMAIALCNLTRMERGEAWRQYANTTGSVARLIEALDAERLALAAACGVAVRSVGEHFRLSFGAEGEDLGAMARALAAGDGDPFGPATTDSRYVTEDVPFGLWPTVCLGHARGVPLPLHSAGVCVFSALYGRDFAAENDVLPRLGDLEELLAGTS